MSPQYDRYNKDVNIGQLATACFDNVDMEGHLLTQETQQRELKRLEDNTIARVSADERVPAAELEKWRTSLRHALHIALALKNAPKERPRRWNAGKPEEQLLQREQYYDPRIEAVMVFSGPGTWFEPAIANDPDWGRWMDRDRIRLGRSLAYEVAAVRKSRADGKQVTSGQLQKEDFQEHAPLFFYNGVPDENAAFREAMRHDLLKIPAGKIVIADEFIDPQTGGSTEIVHTGHQVRSLFQEIENPESPLHGIRNVALVASALDLRIPFYIKQEMLMFGIDDDALQFWFYGLPPRRGSRTLDGREDTTPYQFEYELPRIVGYGHLGNFPNEPCRFENVDIDA